ncbi:MAG: CHASE2 domain-containing protein [Ideonella sp.]
MNIFISYRRDDSSVHARLLYKELLGYFDAEEVFMDIQDIGYGDDFAGLIDQHLEQAEVVLVVIGPHWVDLIEQRLRGDDWVRHEVERALAMRGAGKLRVLPIFVGGSGWGRSKLPANLAGLQKLNALTLADRRFDEDLRTVVEAIRRRRIWDDLVDAVRGRRARLTGVAIGLLAFAAGWVALFDHFGIDSRFATASMWLASVGQSAPWSGEVVLVTIDERTESAIGRSFDASWRAEHAQIIDRAVHARARVLVFDLVLVQPGTAAANEALKAATVRAKGRMPVVFGADGRQSTSAQVQVLAEHMTTGIACAGRSLGLARSLPLAVRRASDATLLPSLALAAFSGGGSIDALDETRQRISVRGMPQDRLLVSAYFNGETVKASQPECPAIQPGDRVLSQLIDPSTLPALDLSAQRLTYEQVLRGERAALDALSGRIVLVGVTRRGEDILDVPAGAPRWGVELIAAQIDGLIRERAVRSAGPVLQGFVSIGMGLAGAMIVIALHRQALRWTVGALLALALLFWLVVVGWYRIELQLISLPYGWAALLLGALAARHILKGKPT